MHMVSRRSLAGAAAVAGAFTASRAVAQRAEPESTFQRISRTRVLRVGAVNGQAPYCNKDITTGEWHGLIIDLANDLASPFGAKVDFIESSWGNAVLDLQADKVDIFFGLSPTPLRALAVDFSDGLFTNTFSLIAHHGFTRKTWADLNDPAVRIAVEAGSVYDQLVTQQCPQATIARMRDARDPTLQVQTGKADCQLITIVLGLGLVAKNPDIGTIIVPTPVIGATTNAAMRREPDKTWRDFVNTWISWSRGMGHIRHSIIANLALLGVKESDIPPDAGI
jgi:polar amino acid transport system substrate-binding protein